MERTAYVDRRRRHPGGTASRGAGSRSEVGERYPLDRLVRGGFPSNTLLRADGGTRSAAMLAAQRTAGNAAVQRMISGAKAPVQREDDPVTAASGTVVADKLTKLSIPFGQLGAYGIKPLALKPWTERELTPEGATVTAGVELEDFWSGTLFKLPSVLGKLRLLPKIGAGVEVDQYDWGTGAVKPKVAAKLIDIGLPKLFKDVDVVGEISATADSLTPSAGVEWSKKDVTISVHGEVEGETGRTDPTSHKSTWEWLPKATFKIDWRF